MTDPKDIKRWWRDSACLGIDTELFFPEDGHTFDRAQAMTCYDCPVKWECRLIGYAEDHGIYSNTAGEPRRKARRAIFGRLWPVAARMLDDHTELRYLLERLAKQPGDVIRNMRAAGFNKHEIGMFMADTRRDEYAKERIAKERRQKTGQHWRDLRSGDRQESGVLV